MVCIKTMIEYMKQQSEGLAVYQTDSIEFYRMSTLRYIKLKCEHALFTYDGYIKSCKKISNSSYKIPVIIDDETMLIPCGNTRQYETIWVNYPAIKSITECSEGIYFTFISGRELKLKITRTIWMRQLGDLIRITNTKVKHFHGH
jgi:competence transcription factor ComK